MDKLPNPEKAFIDLNKLVGYCLNPEPQKASIKPWYLSPHSTLGLNDVVLLKSALLKAVQHQAATLVESNQLGTKYAIAFTMSHQNNTAILKFDFPK